MSIREYKTSDKKWLIELIEELHDYLIPLDPERRMRRQLEYGKNEIDSLVRDVAQKDGIIYVAEIDGRVVGFVAGTISSSKPDDLLGYLPAKRGRVQELFVDEKYRGRKVGKLLMDKIEDYFKQQDCDFIRAEVFEPNNHAYSFYTKLGYKDRDIDMIKMLK